MFQFNFGIVSSTTHEKLRKFSPLRSSNIGQREHNTLAMSSLVRLQLVVDSAFCSSFQHSKNIIRFPCFFCFLASWSSIFYRDPVTFTVEPHHASSSRICALEVILGRCIFLALLCAFLGVIVKAV